MKKYLFILSMASLVNFSFAQTVKPSRTTGAAKLILPTESSLLSSNTQFHKGTRAVPFFPAAIGSRDNLGNTTYDLQTNGSMQRRVLQQGNKISCFWTRSDETFVDINSAFSNRGTGYAHFDGTTWTSSPTSRLETFRTGFSSAFFNGTNQESYICHGGSNNTIFLGQKTGASWNTSTLNTSVANAPIWPHAAASGNWLYIIASPLDSNVHANGIRNGFFFARSNDNGATWLNDMIPLPLIDSVSHYRGGGNSYSISAHGKYVAIACGDMGTDLTLLQSEDYGATWTKKTILDWPIDNYDFAGTAPTDTNNDGIGDTIECNDGSHSLVLDTAGVAHVAFPIIQVYKSGTGGYGFFYTSSLAYYNSKIDSISVIDNIFRIYHDCNNDNTFSIGRNYASSVANAPDAMYNTIGTITQPSISIVQGSPQKVLVTYTAIMDGDTTIDDGIHQYWGGASAFEGQNYRDIFVIGTDDSAKTWTYPVNITRTAHFEEAFPSTPEIIVGDNFPVLYQGDIEPGTILHNSDIYEDEYQNSMILHNVSVNEIFTKGADSTAPCGQDELPLGIKHILSQPLNAISIHPNPSHDVITVKLKKEMLLEKYNYSIQDLTGRTVSNGTFSKNDFKISLTHLNPGMYSITVSNNDNRFATKFIKQ